MRIILNIQSQDITTLTKLLITALCLELFSETQKGISRAFTGSKAESTLPETPWIIACLASP